MSAPRVLGWYTPPDAPHCCLLYVEGGDPERIADRVALIEKSPRVRVKPFATDDEDWRGWEYGIKGDSGREISPGVWGDYDSDSQAWCEEQLRALGYDLTAVSR